MFESGEPVRTAYWCGEMGEACLRETSASRNRYKEGRKLGREPVHMGPEAWGPVCSAS